MNNNDKPVRTQPENLNSGLPKNNKSLFNLSQEDLKKVIKKPGKDSTSISRSIIGYTTPVISPDIQHVRKVMDCFCDLYIEGLTISELEHKTGLPKIQINRVLDAYDGLFISKKFITAKATITFIYLRRARSLKCAYTLYKYSNITSLDFGWDEEDTEFIYEMTNPKFFNRTISSIRQSLVWSNFRLIKVMEKWQNKGIICKKGKRVSFTYLGWPLWAAVIIARIWMKQNKK